MVNSNLKNLRVITGRVRFHYVNLFVPRESLEGGAPKYGMCVIISKQDKETLDNINKAIETALELGEGLWEGKDLGNIIVPLRDGDVERMDRQEFGGAASSMPHQSSCLRSLMKTVLQ